MVETVVVYFGADPLRLLYLIGGSGGIWYWVTLWRNRVRIDVRLIERIMDTHFLTFVKLDLEFEAENLGATATSLSPEATFSAYSKDREKFRIRFQLKNVDRVLVPFTPKRFKLRIEVPDSYRFSWYQAFSFRATRGSTKPIFMLNASNRRISRLRYAFGLVLFKVFGHVPAHRDA